MFLNNFHRGEPSNILSGAAASSITGNNSIILTIESGSNTQGTFFRKYITASQYSVGSNFITGVYSASFAISSYATASLKSEIINAASATFTEKWGSLDGTVGFYTGSFVGYSNRRSALDSSPGRLFTNILNLNHRYTEKEKIKFRVFVEDISKPIVYKKTPYENKSQIFTQMYYRVRDFETDTVIVPFETKSNGTLLSTDTEGMYFEFYMNSLYRGRTYVFDFLIKDRGFDQIFTSVATKFSIE